MTDVKSVDMTSIPVAAAALSPLEMLAAAQAAAEAEVAAEERARQEEEQSRATSTSLADALNSGTVTEIVEDYSIPSMLTVPKPGSNVWTIKLFGEGCTICTALMPPSEGETNRWEEMPCHHSRGNTDCPALEFRISFVGPVVSLVRKYRKRLDKLKESKGAAVHRVRVLGDLSNDLMNFQEVDIDEIMRQLAPYLSPDAE